MKYPSAILTKGTVVKYLSSILRVYVTGEILEMTCIESNSSPSLRYVVRSVERVSNTREGVVEVITQAHLYDPDTQIFWRKTPVSLIEEIVALASVVSGDNPKFVETIRAELVDNGFLGKLTKLIEKAVLSKRDEVVVPVRMYHTSSKKRDQDYLYLPLSITLEDFDRLLVSEDFDFSRQEKEGWTSYLISWRKHL